MAAPPKIRALLCLQNGAKSYATEVETVQTIPDETTALVGYNTASKVFFKENLHAYAVWNIDDKSQPGFKLTPLPDIQPECPIYVDEKAWNGRVVFGNADFHMLFVPVAREEGFSIKGIDVYLPLAGDAVIMKVLPDQNPTNRRKYKRMDPGSQELHKQLKSFVKEVKDIMEKTGFGKSKGHVK